MSIAPEVMFVNIEALFDVFRYIGDTENENLVYSASGYQSFFKNHLDAEGIDLVKQ